MIQYLLHTEGYKKYQKDLVSRLLPMGMILDLCRAKKHVRFFFFPLVWYYKLRLLMLDSRLPYIDETFIIMHDADGKKKLADWPREIQDTFKMKVDFRNKMRVLLNGTEAKYVTKRDYILVYQKNGNIELCKVTDQ